MLGILSAVAAPKFMDLQSDSRVAYLNGLKGAIQSANEVLHAYAVIHGLESLDLNSKSGVSHTKAMVRFDGNKIVQTTTDSDAQGVFFLNYGYVATTYGTSRNSGLVQIIGRNANSTGKGANFTVRNYSGTSANMRLTTCESNESSQDLCYMGIVESGNYWNEAYIVLAGFKPTECALHYEAAKKDANGKIIMPKITIISSGC